MDEQFFDVIVVGAGPAGCTCSLFLAQNGLKVLLLDKQFFPRDKVCADNKSWICTSILKELGLWEKFLKIPKQSIEKMLFTSPSGHQLLIEFDAGKISKDGPHFNVRRKVFDNFLFKAAKLQKNVKALNGFAVESVLTENGKVSGVRGKKSNGKVFKFFSKIVVGADGSNSIVSSSAGINPINSKRFAVAARAYFKGVKIDKKTVELHYLKEVCPGYFWIFPVDANKCNVGIGMPQYLVKKRNIDLEKILKQIIGSEKFSTYFKNAKQVSSIGKWGLTIGGFRKKLSGNGFVLIGDAASTSVTFAGEGVGPAMRSGKIASKAIIRAFNEKDFSAKKLESYEKELWKIIGPENNAMHLLELMAMHPKIFDFVVKKTAKSEKLKKIASSIGSDYKNAAKMLSLETIIEFLKS